VRSSARGSAQLPGKSEADVRQCLDETFAVGIIADATIEDWEKTVLRYGLDSRDLPSHQLLAYLCADLDELNAAMNRHRSASALRRLARVTAQMCGLMCLALCKLDDRPAFRKWARTARIAAHEAGDSETFAWILAQEAYGHYYGNNLVRAIEVAQQAQEVMRSTPCVGSALAAALEARAHALTGRDHETRRSIDNAENILSGLTGEGLSSSAFGYNEGQLRFHEGNAYTHLRNSRLALSAIDRALELCDTSNYTDWSMIRLDRASCLAATGSADEAIPYAVETLLSLTDSQRAGIITLRGREILGSLSSAQRSAPAGEDFRELLQ
jgi:tetratricopeptide (TPR) repeat protein